MTHNQKIARANVAPVRQRTQFSCMAASLAMCLRALGIECSEDEVADVMGIRPMRGASWEDALAAAQHYGCRATLVVPATVSQIKGWTDSGDPVMIAWNPEGREWSHASVVFDVDDCGVVHVADPNIPDPEETVRQVSKSDFYSKWSEKWPRYLVRRPAMRISREITPEGRQVMAKSASMADRFLQMNVLRRHIEPKMLAKSIIKWMQDDEFGGFLAILAERHFYPLPLEGNRFQMMEDALKYMDVDTLLDEMARELPNQLSAAVFQQVADDHKLKLASEDHMSGYDVSLEEMEAELLKLARFAEGENVSDEEMKEEIGAENYKKWEKENEEHKDLLKKKPEGKKATLSDEDFAKEVEQAKLQIQARFEKGKEMSAEDVADYLRDHGAPEAADKWIEEHAKNADKFTEEKGSSEEESTEGTKKGSSQRQRLTWIYPDGIPGIHTATKKTSARVSSDLIVSMFRDVTDEGAKKLASALKGARNNRAIDMALRVANDVLDGFGVEHIDKPSDAEEDNYWGRAAAAYVNTGDLYNPTILYDIDKGEFLLTDYGTWARQYEQRGGRLKAAAWDKAAPQTVEDWLKWEV